MSRAFSTNPAKLSLVDRLADPDRSVGENELSGSNGRPTSIFLKNLARDLSDLLNTRCSLQRYAERDPHAIATLFDFGLPEHTGVFSVSPDEFGQILKRCISDFEPRLADVSVQVQSGSASGGAVRSYRITARVTSTGTQVGLNVGADGLRGGLIVSGG